MQVSVKQPDLPCDARRRFQPDAETHIVYPHEPRPLRHPQDRPVPTQDARTHPPPRAKTPTQEIKSAARREDRAGDRRVAIVHQEDTG